MPSLYEQVLFAVGGVSNALCMRWELITDTNCVHGDPLDGLALVMLD